MPFTAHVAEHNITTGTIGGMLFGQETGMVVDANLTSKAAALTAVDVAQAKMHVAEAMFGERIKASLNMAENYLAGYTAGSNIGNITTIEDGPTKGRMLVL